MATTTPETVISENGLRYGRKPAGSLFGATGQFAAPTFSCFKCGTHRVRAELQTKKLLGRNTLVCADTGQCKKR